MKTIRKLTLAPLGAAKILTRGPDGPFTELNIQPCDQPMA
jgi:hypothetical protein